MREILHDIHFALRTLGRRPSFAVAAVLTLALGIGANTAIFSLVNAFLLRPLPLPEADRLVDVGEFFHGSDRPGVTSVPNFTDLVARSRSFDALAGYWSQGFNLVADGEPERVDGRVVTAGYFDVLGVTPLLGRTFVKADDAPGAPPAVVLHEDLWRSSFGARTDVVGRTVTIDGRAASVVGVVGAAGRASALDMGTAVRAWTAASELPYRDARGTRFLHVIGRLAAGVDLRSAQAELGALSARLEADHAPWNDGWAFGARPLQDLLVASARPSLLILTAAVGLLLFIACANAANLMLARAASRSQEIAVRAALGAGRARIARQLLVESVVLSTAGGAVGLAMAAILLRIGAHLPAAAGMPLDRVTLDTGVLAFTAVLSVATGMLFGLVPVIQASAPDLGRVLRESGRTAGAAAARGRTRRLLVVGEVALALVLLVGTGLLVKSFSKLRGVDPGFRVDDVLTASLSLPGPAYADAHERARAVDEVVAAVTAVPGVVAAGAVNDVPIAGGFSDHGFTVEGVAAPPPGVSRVVQYLVATPGYLDALGIPVLAGRPFAAGDRADAPRVAIVNQAMVRTHFGGTDPIGSRVRWGARPGEHPPWMTVVGVVGDVKQRSLDGSPVPAIYVPHAQEPAEDMDLVVHTASDPAAIAGAVRGAVRAAAPDLPLAAVATMERVLGDSVGSRRLTVLLLLGLGTLAVVLAAVGIFGVMSYAVSQRKHEIGIRLSLGAAPGRVLRLVVGEGAALALGGIAVGSVGALVAGRWLASVLFGVSPADPFVYLLVAAALLVLAAAACLVPARRAAAVDPAVALRGL